MQFNNRGFRRNGLAPHANCSRLFYHEMEEFVKIFFNPPVQESFLSRRWPGRRARCGRPRLRTGAQYKYHDRENLSGFLHEILCQFLVLCMGDLQIHLFSLRRISMRSVRSFFMASIIMVRACFTVLALAKASSFFPWI